MRRILKYNITGENARVSIPEGAMVLHVDNQMESHFLWVEADDTQPMELREFRIFCTGEDLDEYGDDYIYIGTIRLTEGFFMSHVYEKIKP